MGYNQIVVVAVLLLAAATPLAYGQLLNGGNVFGTLCCASSGNCPTGAVGIPGVGVRLNCTTLFGGVTTLAQGVTGPTGFFNLGLNNILGTLGPLLNGLLPCRVIVNIPLNSTICPILSTVNGVLVGVPTLLNTVVNPVLGLVGNLTVPLFVNVTAG